MNTKKKIAIGKKYANKKKLTVKSMTFIRRVFFTHTLFAACLIKHTIYSLLRSFVEVAPGNITLCGLF